MLDESQLHELFEKLSVPSAGRKLVQAARKDAPVRQVQSRGGNVITIMASRKMGCEIRTESRHLEFATAIDLEYDDSVLEFYPQPCELNLELTDHSTGEIHHIRHVPDFLSICQTRIEFEECKSHAKLQRLAQRWPWRYVQGQDGQWHAPLLEQHLSSLGIGYRLVTDTTLVPLRTENLLHLADYMHPGAEECPQIALQTINGVLNEYGHVYVSELLAAPYNLSADHINKGIADRLLVTDLNTQKLTKPNHCRLFRDQTLMQFALSSVDSNKLPAQERFDIELRAGNVLRYQGQCLTISLVGDKEIVCTGEDNQSRSLSLGWVMHALEAGELKMALHLGRSQHFSRYSQIQLQQALARQQQMAMTTPKVSARTVRRWTKRQQDAAANGGSTALALVPRTEAKGNRTARLNEMQQRVIQDVIRDHWVTTEAKNYKACYRQLLIACAEMDIKPPSYPTLIAAIKVQNTNSVVRVRHGKRMAFQLSTFVDVLHADTPQHGSRPFQYVHIDHTQLDIELISSRTDKPLGRPWLTLAIDAFSRRVMAMYLTYEPPSYTSVMMCIRSMVKRYRRLPECVVVDNGKDLTSSAFATFLSTMGVHLRLRPAGQPRHGAVLERLFGRVNSEYVHNLAGNTKATKNVRMTTGKHLPKNFAQWTLESMYFGLEYWAYEYYDQEVHSTLDLSPREAFERGLAQTGAREHRMVLCNQDFMIVTCPPVDRKGERKVNGQHGVKVNDLLYWHPRFAEPNIARKALPVRYDPWDAGSVYVWVGNEWLRAQCRSLLALGHVSERERQALSEEYRNRRGRKVDQTLTTQRLQEFMRTFTPKGTLAVELDRHQEHRMLYGKLAIANVSEVVLPRKLGLAVEAHQTPQPIPPQVQPSTLSGPQLSRAFSAPDTPPPFDLFDTF